MAFQSINPATGETLAVIDAWDEARLESALALAARAAPCWAATPVDQRCEHLRRVAGVLRSRQEALARLITLEMGKLIREARAEVEKCALACDYYARHASDFLADEVIPSDAGRSYVAHQPLGTVLAVMPWNFPLWQVFRFAAPALAAGNTALLKHASNVPQCAQAIETVFAEAGLPEGVFLSLMITSDQVAGVIADDRVRAVTLTGSEAAGRAVAACAGRHLKKTVLELGGSDPFIVLADADLEAAVATALTSRFLNAGQSCIAAKRFILVPEVADAFLERFRPAVEALRCGDPLDEATTLAPLARPDLREELHRQVQASIAAGASAVTGCSPHPGRGAFYLPSILDRVGPGMPAWEEELFGPVAVLIRVADEDEALAVANGSRFGLGGSVWTRDLARGEALARRIESGAVFVNGLVKSDPRLPFGGIKASGYGRELSRHGLMEFVNQKTVWIGQDG
ncbi:MAG TPA: NAD-dependent succinate-semialdehyde dehydrogenase [Gammaproteobacteria bacterium]|nr:NAD-dependent succinate-semialdehyde dehydrogenase [Gammaproteobacteria bacterium]